MKRIFTVILVVLCLFGTFSLYKYLNRDIEIPPNTVNLEYPLKNGSFRVMFAGKSYGVHQGNGEEYALDIVRVSNIKDIFDIILCGYHIGVIFSSFKDFWNFIVLNILSKYSKTLRNSQIEKNTCAVINALNKNKIDILTHPGDKIPVNIDKIAYAAQKNNTILEISNHHKHLNSEEIKIAAKYTVKFVISSDSHIKDNIGSFENGLRAAEEAGLTLSRIINLSRINGQ